jgi:hypothetical protein
MAYAVSMRTTLTLDKDVAAALEQVRKSRDASLKAVANEALRLGLRQMQARPKRRGAFRTRAVSLGSCKIGSLDNIAEALAIAEGEGFE